MILLINLDYIKKRKKLRWNRHHGGYFELHGNVKIKLNLVALWKLITSK